MLKPHSIKKGWDSLNLVLVLFAIVCGFLSRNSGEDENRNSQFQEQEQFHSGTPGRGLSGLWRDKDRDLKGSGRSRMGRMRSFGSHPDLRRYSEDVDGLRWGYGDRRFYDDTYLYNGYRYSGLEHGFDGSLDGRKVVAQPCTAEKSGGGDVKDVGVDVNSTKIEKVKVVKAEALLPATAVEDVMVKEVVESPPPAKVIRRRVRRTYEDVEKSGRRRDDDSHHPPPAPPPPPPRKPPYQPATAVEDVESPPPANVIRRRVRRTYEDVEKSEMRDDSIHPPAAPPPPPRKPPSPPYKSPYTAEVEEMMKSEKKRSSATKEFLNSLKRKKKKKQRQKSVENLDSFFNYESLYTLPTIPPPSPPPPPPPPPPFFQNLFSKKRKPKKTHSTIDHSVPPPPPPPPPRQRNKTVELKQKTTATSYNTTTEKPHTPLKISNYRNEISNSSGESSSFNRTPPPPPPLPPFNKSVKTRSYKIAAEEILNSGGESPMNGIPPPPPLPPWRFEINGDDVKVENTGSPYSDSGGGEATASSTSASLFCPSPDVNTKADDFIKRFRDGLRLEKLNSVKEKEGRIGKSNLGPQSGPM